MPLTNLSISNVGPFEEVEFEFDRQVNVFTGPNNTGKSSALSVLGDIAVYPFSFPDKLLHPGRVGSFICNFSNHSNKEFSGQLPCRVVTQFDHGPQDDYWTKERSDEHISVLGTIGYSKFIPALRRSTDYRSPGPTVKRTEDYTGGHSGGAERDRRLHFQYRREVEARSDHPELKKRLSLISDDPSLVSDEAVIQKMIELHYRSYLKAQPRLSELLVQIGELASTISAGFINEFNGVDEDPNGFFPQFDTVDGPMPLNTLSQGTQSIIQWLAYLLIDYAEYYGFPEDLQDKPGTLIIDEIDAHLHPSWQRRIIPTLTQHLPNLQIFCSTHSPLMLAGLKEGQIQLLQRDESNRITVSRNTVDVDGWTADEILRNFLGVHDPTDLETVGRLEKLQYLRGRDDLSAKELDELNNLRRAVSQGLLNGPLSPHLEQLAETLAAADADSTRS